jgi:hypothetical protein
MKDQDHLCSCPKASIEELERKVRFCGWEVGYAWEDYIKARADLEAYKLVSLAEPFLHFSAPEHENEEFKRGWAMAQRLILAHPRDGLERALTCPQEPPPEEDVGRGFFTAHGAFLAKLEELGADIGKSSRILNTPCPVLE